MKKIILALATGIFITTSCTDQLEILPNDSIISEQAFTSVNDLQLGMNGIYREYSPDNIIEFSSIFTDDTKIGKDNGGQAVGLHNQILNSGSGSPTGIWVSRYGMINSINRLLDASSSILPNNDGEQVIYNKIIGDCYALRAFAHFELLQFYSETYDSNSLAVPYVDYVGVFEKPERNTVSEVVSGIDNDLAQSLQFLDPSFSDNAYVTVDFITALQARKALYVGDYNEAISKSATLISKYPLATRDEYVNLFRDQSQVEVIFKSQRNNLNDPNIGGNYYFTGTGGAFIEMSNGLYNTFDSADIRSNVLLDVVESDPANNIHNIGKYLGKNGFAYLNDVKVFRVSEMYLINAEAKALTGDRNGAALMIKTLRDARFGSGTTLPVYTSDVTAVTDILAERRLELAYEGHRYLDLKRTRSITNKGIERDGLDCGGATPCNLAVNDYRFTLPIPQVETNANGNIVQNQGYN
jgi:hypothetical protein